MKKTLFGVEILLLVILCACTTKENNEKPVMTPTATVTPTSTPMATPTTGLKPTQIPEELQEFNEYIEEMETADWMDLDIYADKETSIRNSNRLNYGYVTYDEAGQIYFVDKNNGDLYVSDYNGANKRLICQTGDKHTGFLWVNGEWLYFSTQRSAVKRVHLKTGEIEQLTEELMGQYYMKGEKLYTTRQSGEYRLCAMDLDGSNKEVIDATLNYTYIPMYSEKYMLSEIAAWWGTGMQTKSNLFEGHLMLYNGEKKILLNQRGSFPLIAGNYICFSDPGNIRNALTTKTRVWNLETKEEIVLGSYVNKNIVSDGETIYFAKVKVGWEYIDWEAGEKSPDEMRTFFYKWDGGEPELIWILDTQNTDNIFLTPKALYAMPNPKVDGKWTYQLWYYDLETGESGQIH